MKKRKVESIKHDDRRVNIPTSEMRGFVAKEEQKPYNVSYERDPSLDPQLVWDGKDVEDLDVPAVPIYIQEKIHPRALIEDLQARSESESEAPNLFSDFNGLDDDLEKRVEFYEHEQNWSNRMILGDSLLVMNSLAEKEGMRGKVQMIYIDPPYGIKFGSNWQVSTRKRDVKDGKAEDIAREPEVIRAYRDTWEKGIHSYLTYLRDRFMVARELLNETGSIFVQIGDENVHLVRSLLDEVFGSAHFVSQITFRKKLMPLGAKTLESMNDFLLWYAKDKEQVRYRQLYRLTQPDPTGRWTGVEVDGGMRRLSPEERRDFSMIAAKARIFGTVSQWAPSFSEANVYDFEYEGQQYAPTRGQCWITSRDKMRLLGSIGRLFVEGKFPRYVFFHDDFPYAKITNPWHDTAPAQNKTYVVQTNERVLERCLLMTTDPGDLVIDPTCGSGTTACVAEQWGRRWITMDTSRVSLALARTRLMSARYPFYQLSDSKEGLKKESELTGQVPPDYKTYNDVRKGFVYERVPHVTLKSIANNPDIKKGMSRKEIDTAISRHTDQELLYDKPYVDKKKVRVAGPFTVESLSPHRVLSTDDERPASEDAGDQDAGEQFVPIVIENLLTAGVQNTRKGERLKLDSLQPHAGTWIQAKGEFTDADGKTKRIAVSIGPELGSVGTKQIQEAAKEAVQGLGHDILIVCGYAFDPHVGEEAKKYGDLVVLPAKMNEDLRMGKALKKTSHGNLFMVFGEPDISYELSKDGMVEVEVHGVDVYDPTTGEIRSDSPDEIACWFIDTNYNGESFFVRHAYFLGADDPYKKLKTVLRAEIDEDAWASLYSPTSRPFPKPSTGKFAVKVINHYGDEVMQVIEL